MAAVKTASTLHPAMLGFGRRSGFGRSSIARYTPPFARSAQHSKTQDCNRLQILTKVVHILDTFIYSMCTHCNLRPSKNTVVPTMHAADATNQSLCVDVPTLCSCTSGSHAYYMRSNGVVEHFEGGTGGGDPIQRRNFRIFSSTTNALHYSRGRDMILAMLRPTACRGMHKTAQHLASSQRRLLDHTTAGEHFSLSTVGDFFTFYTFCVQFFSFSLFHGMTDWRGGDRSVATAGLQSLKRKQTIKETISRR